MKRLRERNDFEEHLTALELASRSMRRGNLRETKEWLAIAERCARYHRQLMLGMNEDARHDAWTREQPLRLKALEQRTRSQR